jgi:hypothetical protein
MACVSNTAEKAPFAPIVAGVVTLLMVMLTVSLLGGNRLPAEMVPLRATEAVPNVIVCEAKPVNVVVALFTVSVVLVSVALLLLGSPLYPYVIVYGVMDTGIVEVLNVTGPKLLGFPFRAMPPTGAPLIVMVTVPAIIGTPFKRPLRLIEAVPNTIDCEAVRPANVGVILFTLRVKFCVASVPTPLLAVMVIG